MPVAIDTVVAAATNPGASPATDNAATNPGDSKTVRNFAVSSKARLDFVERQGATAGFVSVKSPRFHDVSRGLQFQVSETPTTRLLPPEVGQPVYPADILQLTVSGGAAESDALALGIYYYDLPGSQALLKMPGDIYPNIQNLKPTQVTCTTSATPAGWVDIAVNATENLLKANAWYAVLGYEVDAAALTVGVRGPETGNYRICGPSVTAGFDTADYFIWMAERHNAPYIPCFNGNNRANFFVSLAAVATAATVNVTLQLAEMVAGWAP